MSRHTPTPDDGRIDEERFADNGITHVLLEFRPERWETRYGDDHAVQAGDTISYLVPVDAVLDDDGMLIEERSYEMDQLRGDRHAPPTVKSWDGPFEIYYDEFLSHPANSDQPPTDAIHATVTFHPQIPVHGDLVVPSTKWTFSVPARKAMQDNGSVVENDADASDRLADYEHAPEIVRRWTELTGWYFRVTIDSFTIRDTKYSPDQFESVYGHLFANGGENDGE